MRRPIRTRRLSIAAMVSLLLIVAVTAEGIRSFKKYDELVYGYSRQLVIIGGDIGYTHTTGIYVPEDGTLAYSSGEIARSGWGDADYPVCRFQMRVTNTVVTGPGPIRIFEVWVPLWFLLLFLLIAPVLWLMSRRASTLSRPAFPVITDPK